MKPYYQDDAVAIYHGDCREVLPLIDPVPQLVIADPPYMNKLDEAWDRAWGNDEREFLGWLDSILAVVPLDERGTLAVFASPEMAARVEVKIAERFQILNHIVWRKPVPGSLGQADKDGMRRFWPASERIILAEHRLGTDHHLYGFTQRARHATARVVYDDLRARLVAWRDAAGMSNREVDALIGTRGMAGHYFQRLAVGATNAGTLGAHPAGVRQAGRRCPSVGRIAPGVRRQAPGGL